MTASLRDTNNMLREQGFNIPYSEDTRGSIIRADFATGREVAFHADEDERSVMDAAGWDVDSTAVDLFMERPDIGFTYLQGMSRDYYDHNG